MLVIQTGENVPVTAFALNGPDSVLKVKLQVMIGPEMLPRTSLQEVDVHEGW